MFKVFSFCALYLFSSLVYGQNDDFEPGTAIEINQSKENISSDPFSTEDSAQSNADPATENSNSMDIDNFVTPEESPSPEESSAHNNSNESNVAEPDVIPVEDETVLVRERIEAVPQNQGNGNPDNLVEVRYAQAVFLPYKERQNPWGFSVSFGAEFMFFPNLISQFDNATFDDMFGTQNQMAPSLELGPKYNMSWGSLGLTFGYMGLDIKDDRLGAEAGIKFNRYSVTAAYYLDTLSKEAYFVPYVAAGMWQADYQETSDEYPGEKEKYSTDIGYHWRAGALFGLGWLEPDLALRSRRSPGLQETFLNIYVSSTYMSESDPDPDLESEMDVGATILLEF